MTVELRAIESYRLPPSSNPIDVPRNAGRVYALGNLRKERAIPSYVFQYYYPFRLDLYHEAILECFSTRCDVKGASLFFEMEEDIFFDFSLFEHAEDLHRKRAFEIREALELKIYELSPDIFYRRLDRVRSDPSVKQNLMASFILFYEYYRTIKFEIINGNEVRAAVLYCKCKKEILHKDNLPYFIQDKMNEMELDLSDLIKKLPYYLQPVFC